MANRAAHDRDPARADAALVQADAEADASTYALCAYYRNQWNTTTISQRTSVENPSRHQAMQNILIQRQNAATVSRILPIKHETCQTSCPKGTRSPSPTVQSDASSWSPSQNRPTRLLTMPCCLAGPALPCLLENKGVDCLPGLDRRRGDAACSSCLQHLHMANDCFESMTALCVQEQEQPSRLDGWFRQAPAARGIHRFMRLGLQYTRRTSARFHRPSSISACEITRDHVSAGYDASMACSSAAEACANTRQL